MYLDAGRRGQSRGCGQSANCWHSSSNGSLYLERTRSSPSLRRKSELFLRHSIASSLRARYAPAGWLTPLFLFCLLLGCNSEPRDSLAQAYIGPASVNLRAQLNQKNSAVTVLRHGAAG